MNSDFSKEEFLNNCCLCGCDKKSRETLLMKIEEFKNSDPDTAKFLIRHRDELVRNDKKQLDYRKLRIDLGDKEVEKRTVIALRALADKVEYLGPGLILYCELPEVPIFSGKDDYFTGIDLSVAKCPLGG